MAGSGGNLRARMARALVAVALTGAAATAQAPVAHAADCPWMNARMPAEQRAHLLLGALTLDQKVALVHGGGTSVGKGAGSISAIPELCVPALGLADGAAGLGNGNTGVTAFPAPIAQAAAFDPAQQETFGHALGDEFVAKGENDWLAPHVNPSRYPKNSRNLEADGEGPYLAGQTAAPGIRGVQSRNVIGTVKHYIGNESETNRNYESAEIDDRTLHEMYLPGFEAAVRQGDVGSVMCAYNRVNGPYACGSSHVLQDVLKSELGFKGFVVSDWVFAAQSVTYANDGLDMEMPFPIAFAGLSQAVQAGIVPVARLNDMVFPILFPQFRLGLFDHPVAKPAASVSTTPHRRLARSMAADGSV